jgi:hypothetical protein
MAAPSYKGILDGGGDLPPPKMSGGDDTDPDADEDMDQEGDSDLPPEFESAYDAYEQNPSAKTFWDAVEACTGNKPGGGLALLLGGKSKTSKSKG